MSDLRRRARRLVLGEAGPAPALVLAGVALVIAFIVTAGPRALTAADTRATRQAVGQAPPLDTAVVVTADLQARPGSGVLQARTIDALASRFTARLPGPGLFPASLRWAGVVMPARTVLLARPPADGRPRLIEAAYRSRLASHSVVVAGSLPTGPAVVRPAAAGRTASIMLNMALTRVTAVTFHVSTGSVIDLGPAWPGGPRVLLKVTGIIRPLSRAAAFWQRDPELTAPELEGKSTAPHWRGGGFVGRGELAGLAAAYSGDTERATWFFPMTSHLAAADVGRVEAAAAALASGPALRDAETEAGASVLADTAVSTGLADGLATFNSQWHVTVGVDSVLVVGLFVAGIALLLICCGLAAEAYRPELTLLRVRGGSLRQVAGRMLARSCCIVLLPLAAGVTLAVAVLPGGGTSVTLVTLTALAAVTATPAIAFLEHRRQRPGAVQARTEAAASRGSARRLTGELAVLLVAAAAVADLRLRGAGQEAGGVGTTSVYLSASAVLVAAAVALIVNRAHRGPLRLLASAASIWRGAVGAVGLARAARSRAGSVLPALALMLGLTLTVFSAMVLASISSGQLTGSWERTGADARITIAGTTSVSGSVLDALAKSPGVLHATPVFTAPSAGAAAAVLKAGTGGQPVAIAVVDPASYAALAAGTPWSGFPARALARPASVAASGPIPLLVTPALAARFGADGSHGALRLEEYGQFVSVRIAGTITRTPAMPAGGEFVLLPRWAALRLTAVPPPSTVLVTGPHLNIAALRATVAKVLPGSQVVFRRQVLAALNSSPALRLSESLYLAGAVAAAAVSALAVLFWLIASARSRAAMLTRLGALGMARSQALLLGLTEAVPLLTVATAGTAACVWLLAVIVGPVLGLNTFTGSAQPAALAPTWADLFAPLGGAAVLAVTFLAIDGALAGRRELAVALRHEEAG